MSQQITINLPATTGSPDSMVRYVQSARQVLALANTNFDRVKVRDQAERAKGVAAALGMRAVATECSIIVADAERMIAQETPPQQGHRTDLDPPEVVNALPPGAASKMRQAHAGLTEAQYEDLKARARANNELLSRRRIATAARSVQQTDTDHATKKAETQEPKRYIPESTTEISLRHRINDLEIKLADREERIALMTESDQAADIDERFRAQAEVIAALRQQVSLWQGRYNTEKARADRLSAMLRKMEERHGTQTIPG